MSRVRTQVRVRTQSETGLEYYSPTDNRYFEPIYVSGVKMKMPKINNNKSSDKKRSLNAFKHVFNSENC